MLPYIPTKHRSMRRHDTIDIFPTIRTVLARNLEIDPDAIDLEFQFHDFIDRIALRREQRQGSKHLLNYLEAANIYIDLAEAFEIEFMADFTSKNCITVADLILLIRSKLDGLD
jgi:hypothetical protein